MAYVFLLRGIAGTWWAVRSGAAFAYRLAYELLEHHGFRCLLSTVTACGRWQTSCYAGHTATRPAWTRSSFWTGRDCLRGTAYARQFGLHA
jgi:hypothetical protein